MTRDLMRSAETLARECNTVKAVREGNDWAVLEDCVMGLQVAQHARSRSRLRAHQLPLQQSQLPQPGGGMQTPGAQHGLQTTRQSRRA